MFEPTFERETPGRSTLQLSLDEHELSLLDHGTVAAWKTIIHRWNVGEKNGRGRPLVTQSTNKLRLRMFLPSQNFNDVMGHFLELLHSIKQSRFLFLAPTLHPYLPVRLKEGHHNFYCLSENLHLQISSQI